MNETSKEKISSYVTILIIFVCMSVFFGIIHPMYIYDGDDWTYISAVRTPLPSIKEYNPTRILPEILMPLVSKIAVSIGYPISHDYIACLSWAFAITVSLFIAIYFYMLINVIKSEFVLTYTTGGALLIVLFLLHFYLKENTYVFYGANITTYFYYIIPAILSTMTTFYLIQTEEKNRSNLENGFLLLLIYLCVFSNVLSNALLMAYTAYSLIKSLCYYTQYCRSREIHFFVLLGNFIKNNIISLFTALLWIFAEIIEIQGGRAKAIGGGNFQIGEAVKLVVEYICDIRPIVRWTFIILLFIGLSINISLKVKRKYADNDKKFIEILIRNLSCFVLTIIYLIVVCSKVDPGYMSRGSININWILLLALFAGEIMAYVYKKYDKTIIILPIIVFLLVSSIYHLNFPENWGYNITAEDMKKWDDNVIAQVMEADHMGAVSIELHVPKYSSESNWPLPRWGGDRMSKTLFRHGMISKEMDIIIVPNEAINKQFHIP